MESAGSLKSRLPAQPCRVSNGALQWRLAAYAVLFAWGTASFYPKIAIQTWVVLCVILLVLLWRFHLERASLPAFWNCLLAGLLALQLLLPLLRTEEVHARSLLGTLCCCLLLYLLMRTLATAISNPGLQEVASSALILAIALYSRPAAVVGAALLSVILWLRCRASYGGALKSGLLIYTPAAVGILTIVVMQKLTPGVYSSALSALEVFSPGRTLGGESVTSGLQQLFPALVFAASAVSTRIIERRAGYGDLAYLATLLFLVACLCLGVFPGFITVLDMGMILYAGAMCLLAMAPPRRVWSLLFITAAVIVSLGQGFGSFNIFVTR